jgi:hypothetical protein
MKTKENKFKKFKYHQLLLLFLINIAILTPTTVVGDGQNSCFSDRIEKPIFPKSRVILMFKCYSGVDYNPRIPMDDGSREIEYNELILAPNIYTKIPFQQLCLFKRIYFLDLSYNLLTNLTNAFKSLECLESLRKLDISNNYIKTPLLASDFNDQTFKNIEHINMNRNRIPFVETRLFFKLDGSSRFPKMKYLGLANNKIKQFDLLWPMSLPNRNVHIDLSNNNIDTLINQMNLDFRNESFMPMINNRRVDIINNDLRELSDSNLLQYGLNSNSDFKLFLTKITNYDFRQHNNLFQCKCPKSTGSYTVHWYKSFSDTVNKLNGSIHQLTCANIPDAGIFDFNCKVRFIFD